MALEEQKGLEQERKSLSRERETLKTEKSATRKSIERDVIDKNDYAQSAKQLQTANENYAQQLYQLGISEKQIQSVTDNRNFFQKILNLKENQGIIGGTLALLGRPAEAAQGILAASAQGGDVLKYAWEGLHGDKEYSLKDIGIDLGNPLMNAMANMAFEAGVDPFNFINLPWKTLFSKGKDLMSAVNTKVAAWAGRSKEGQALYNAFQDKWVQVTDFFKKLFGTWGDPEYKEFANEMSNVSAQSIKDQNTYQLLLKTNLKNVEDLDQHIFERIVSDDDAFKLSVSEINDLETTLELKPKTISNLRSGNDELVALGRTELFNKLSTYLSRKFESTFKHGWSMGDTFQRLLDEGIVEPAALSEDAVKTGQAYKTIKQALGWALQSNPKYINYDVEDLVEIVEFTKARKHLGQELRDAAGNVISTAAGSLHKQGYIIQLTEAGEQVFAPYFNKIKANLLMSRALSGANLKQEQIWLNELITNKALKLNSKDASSVEFVDSIKRLYKDVTGQELMVYGRNVPGQDVYEVRFAPNKELYEYAQELNKQKEQIRKTKVRIDKTLRSYKKLNEPIIQLNGQIAELSASIQQDLLLAPQQVLSNNPKEWDNITEELEKTVYGPLVDIMKERQKQNPEAIFMTEPVSGEGLKIAWGRAQQGFADWSQVLHAYYDNVGDDVLDIGGLRLQRSSAQAKGSKYTIKVDFDWGAMNHVEKINVIGYAYTRGLITQADLAGAGITSWDKLTNQAASKVLQKVISKHSYIVLGQAEKIRDFINLSEWITNDMIYSGRDVAELAGDIWDHIKAGRLTSDEAIMDLASYFGQDQMWSWMYQHADNLTQITADKIEAVKVLQATRTEALQKVKQFELDHDVERLQVLKDTMESGVYQGAGKTEMGRVLQDLHETYRLEDVAMELDTRIYWQEQASYDIIRQITRVEDDLAKAFQRTWNSKRYQPIAEFFNLGEKVSVNQDIIADLTKHVQSGAYTPLYAVKNDAGIIQLTSTKPQGVPKGTYVILDQTSSTELLNYYTAFGKKYDLQRQLTLINDNVVELQMIQHANRYPDTKYNYETLETILQEEYARWANEVNDTLLAQMKPNFQNKEVQDYVVQQTQKIQEAEESLVEIDKKIESGTEEWKQKSEELKKRQASELSKKETALKTKKTKSSKKSNENLKAKKEWEAKDAAKTQEVKQLKKQWTAAKKKPNNTSEIIEARKKYEAAQKDLATLRQEKTKALEKMQAEEEKAEASLHKTQQELVDLKEKHKQENEKFQTDRSEFFDQLYADRKKWYGSKAQSEEVLSRIANKQQYFEARPMKNFIDELDEAIYDDAATFANPLSEADLAAKNVNYTQPMRQNLKLLQNLLNPEKSIAAYQQALKNLPDAFVTEVNRFINVQEALWQNIASNFEKHLGISMDGWNVKGYLRHMLTPEMASLQAIEHTLNEKYTGVMSQVFGKNLKKIALHREYQASAADINAMMVDDLFNTNPIQVTAMALDILPDNFLLGNTFKNILDNNLLVEVDLSSRALDLKGINSLVERLENEVDKLEVTKNRTTYQDVQLAEKKATLADAVQYQDTLQRQQEYVLQHPEYKWDPDTVQKTTDRINNQLKEIDNQIQQSREAGTKDLTKQLQEKKQRLKEELSNMSANINPDVQAQRTIFEEELSALSPKLIKAQSEGFARSDSWLRDAQQFKKDVPTMGKRPGEILKESKQFGKEWMWVDKSTLDEMSSAMDVLKAAATQEQLSKADWGKQFVELQKGLESGKHYAIHKGVFEYLKRYSRAAKVKEGNQIWAALQRFVVSPFKRLSVFSVGFHVRNLMTNYANAYLAGFNPFDLHNEMTNAAKDIKVFEEIVGHLDKLLATGNWRTADEQADLLRQLLDKGVKFTDITSKATIDVAFNAEYRRVFDEYLDMAARGVIGNNMFSRELIQMMGKLRDQAFGRFSQINLLELKSSTKLVGEKIRSITEKSFQLSKRMDDQAKVAMYRLAQSEKYRHLAEEVGFSGETIQDLAEKYVKFVLFDYNNLTAAEENVMKTIFPFYTWARKNLEFQLKNFFGAGGTRTKRYKIFSDALQGWKQGMASEEEYPEYTDNYIPIWNDGGTITFIKFTPSWADVDNLLAGDGIVNMLSPLIKTPLEMITGYDFFTHKQFNTHGVMPGFGLGLNSLTRTFDIAMKSIFQNYAPTWEDKKLAGAIGKKILDAVELAKHVFSFGSSVRDDGLVSSLGALLPSVFTSSNIQQTLYFNAKERQEQLRKAMSYYLDFEK